MTDLWERYRECDLCFSARFVLLCVAVGKIDYGFMTISKSKKNDSSCCVIYGWIPWV